MNWNDRNPINLPTGRIIEYALDWKQADSLTHELLYGLETLEHAIDANYNRSSDSYLILRSVSLGEEIQSSVDKRIIIPGCSINLAGFVWKNQ